jgi:Tfp pilus assembly major pilin PilA
MSDMGSKSFPRFVRPVAFTLVELMIMIAIVMVLAAIAIPMLRDYALKAKLGELAVNYDSLWDTVYLYRETEGVSLGGQSSWNPVGVVAADKKTHPWVTSDTFFNTIGWRPDGDTRCGYSFTLQNVSGALAMMAHGGCDVDDDDMGIWVWDYDDWGAIGNDYHFATCWNGAQNNTITMPGSTGWTDQFLTVPCR